MQHITVVPYDPAWPGLYEAEAQAIAGVLGQRLTAIHHIGSTAVPGWLQSRHRHYAGGAGRHGGR